MVVVLVTGASSSPGYKTVLALLKRGASVVGVYNQHPISIPGAEMVKADLVKDAEKVVRDYKPSILVHVAALGDVDACESNKQLCYTINVVATRRTLYEASRLGAKIIYLSTDYVFDGSKGLYRENDPPNPINYYGLTKLLGEETTLTLGGVVVRTSAIYGLGPGRPNFGKVVVEKLSKGETIKAFIDQWLSPTLNTFLGEALAKLALDLELSREILHVAGPRMSRYEFAKAIARVFGFNEELIKPTSMSQFSFKAPRPRDSSLRVAKAEQLLGIAFSDIDKALKVFHREYHEGKRLT